VSDSEFLDWDSVLNLEIDCIVFACAVQFGALHEKRPARMAVGISSTLRQAGD
jgi:hypothetical protein